MLQKRFPDAGISMPRPSTIPGYYEVNLGSQVLYVSGNGRYLILGDLIDLQHDANLSEARRAALRRQLLSHVAPQDMIVLGAKHAQRMVTVFTNIHCQYCRQEDQALKTLVAGGGLQVRYVLLPDGPKGSANYAETASLWCARNPLKALENAFAGIPVSSSGQCPAPMTQNLNLARKLNIQGLPSMVLDNGSMVTGFLSTAEIRQWLVTSPPP